MGATRRRRRSQVPAVGATRARRRSLVPAVGATRRRRRGPHPARQATRRRRRSLVPAVGATRARRHSRPPAPEVARERRRGRQREAGRARPATRRAIRPVTREPRRVTLARTRSAQTRAYAAIGTWTRHLPPAAATRITRETTTTARPRAPRRRRLGYGPTRRPGRPLRTRRYFTTYPGTALPTQILSPAPALISSACQ